MVWLSGEKVVMIKSSVVTHLIRISMDLTVTSQGNIPGDTIPPAPIPVLSRT